MINVIVSAVSKILRSLIPMQKLLFANNCWSKQNYECPIYSCPIGLTFICTELSETLKSFVKIRPVPEIKSVGSFIKTRFYWKRGCIKMVCRAEKVPYISGLKSANCLIYTNFVVFKIENCSTLFKLYLHEYKICTLLLFIWKWITSTLSFIWNEKNGNIFILSFERRTSLMVDVLYSFFNKIFNNLLKF